MKVSILWAGLASYSVAFFRELALSQGCQVQLIYRPPGPAAPYRGFDLSFCDSITDSKQNREKLQRRVEDFAPDWVLMASWNYPHFMRIAKRLKQKGVFVLSAMDNQWTGSAKQWLGVTTSRVFLKPAITTFLVAGDRQALFARKLGYHDVLYGLYAGDVRRFTPFLWPPSRPNQFLFVGRLAEEKGVRNLIEGYHEYRSRRPDPWGLTIVGTGPLVGLVEATPVVDYIGFVDPQELPSVFGQAGCFILPSTREPWGVVIHEAAAAGLPVICTYRCGASTLFVRDGLNGFVIPPTAGGVAGALTRMSNLSDSERARMSLYGRSLAELWTPQLQAEYVVTSIRSRIDGARVEGRLARSLA